MIERGQFSDETALNCISSARKSADAIRRGIDRLSPYYDSERQVFVFTTKPSEVANRIVQRYTECTFIFDKNVDQPCSIVFPVHIFEGMVTELVKNAKRFASPPPNILMDWTLKGGRLHFSVHDNGTSCPLSGADGFVPLDVFLEQAGVAESRLHGLDLINRISLLADGMLLFAKSQILSGLHVMFTITDIASGSSGG